jgi:predicted amino acid-binding ACT domain protein
MAVTVRKITLWRRESGDRPGLMAETLRPLAGYGASLNVAMGYRQPGSNTAVIEVSPVSGKKSVAAAESTGLVASTIPTLLVEGDDRPGLGYALSHAVADAGINLDFLVAQVVGRKFSAIFGFGSEEDAKKATGLIKKAARPAKKKDRKK